MKKFLLLFLTAALCLGLFGCQQGGEGQVTTTSEEITTPEESTTPEETTTIGEDTETPAQRLRRRLYGNQEVIYSVSDIDTLVEDILWARNPSVEKPTIETLFPLPKWEIQEKYGDLRDGRGLAILILDFKNINEFHYPTAIDDEIVLRSVAVKDPQTIEFLFCSAEEKAVETPETAFSMISKAGGTALSEATGIKPSMLEGVGVVAYQDKWICRMPGSTAMEIDKNPLLETMDEVLTKFEFKGWLLVSHGDGFFSFSMPCYS